MLANSSFRTNNDGEYICTADHFPANRLGPWLSAVVDASLDSVLVIDGIGQIVLANAQAGALFCEAAQDLVGRSFDILLAPHERIDYRASLCHLACKPAHRRRMRLHTTLECARSNGQYLQCEAVISCRMLRGTIFFSVILRATRGRTPRLQRIESSADDLRQRAIFSHHNHEIEKRRFSRVLYDDLGQSLGVLKLDMDGLQQSLSAHQSATLSRVSSMQATLDGAISRVKSIASALRPPLLDDFGLMAALKWMAAAFQKKSGIPCTVKKFNVTLQDDDQIESAIFRLVQESLTNIEQHAQATAVMIFLWQHDCSLDVLVHDDGIGIQKGSPQKPGCYGLIAMQERITTLEGRITINNIEPHGLAIHASIPLSSN